MEKTIFRNYGGSYQISVEKGSDLLNILKLDDALWVATSVPVEILNCDRKFLEYLDTDKNNRIRTDEVRQAIKYVLSLLKDPSIIDGTDTLLLSDINTETEKGKLLKKTAEIVLENLKAEKKEKINLSQVRNLQTIMSNSISNGDGIITPDATEDEELSSLIKIIMEKIGTKKDASGKDGIDSEIVDEFFTQCREYLLWYEKGKIQKDQEKTEIMIFGQQTAYLYSIFKDVEEKFDQYFLLSAISRFDEKIIDTIKLNQEEIKNLEITDRNLMTEKLNKIPIAIPDTSLTLDFEKVINPIFEEKMRNFKENLFTKIFPETDKITFRQWQEVKKLFSNYRNWIENKKGEKVESLGEENIKKYLEGDYREKIRKLIEKDLEVAPLIQNINDLEKLILYKKYLIEFLNNYVNFSNVYNPEITSMYEAGVLVIDGRKLKFTMNVKDINSHKKVASLSNTFIMYLNITGKQTNQLQFQIVAPLTSGEAGRIRIGKKGIFIDRNGNEWDAEVIDIIKNPVGLLEAIKAPFIKIADNIKSQIEKIAETKQKRVEQALVSPSSASFTRDLMVGGSVAVAAIGSSFAYITKVFSQIKIIHLLSALGIIAGLILIPSIIVGILRLSRRDLSILFEASGCAINFKMKLGTKLGRIFTFIPDLPENSKKIKVDVLTKFAGLKRNKRLKVLVWILVLIIIVFVFFLISLKRGKG